MRIIKYAASIGKNLGFDRYEAETLCDQIQKYINEQKPFDLDIGFAKDNPVNCEIGDILRDISDDSDENNAEDNEVDDSGNNKRAGEGDYDYDIDDVLGMNDGDNNDDNYDDNEE
ncbi:hypothetical protein GLOIN_2v1783329 [Rhizophagus irregularis DAOM 181602=DAOM 197198]|nr:hypothetical protein GLOIN_2v1783329 [Rhizophagus irregularis DAOM 181602=DAOM 197198]